MAMGNRLIEDGQAVANRPFLRPRDQRQRLVLGLNAFLCDDPGEMLGLPFRPRRAIEKLTESCGLADYFGADYLRAYAACKDAELESFESQISPLEYTWFLQAD